MDTSVPRLRMFAGPNGSGKSTINKVVRPEILGTYINPDDLVRNLVSSAGLDFSQFEIDLSLDSIRDFFKRSDFLRLTGTTELASGLEASGDRLFYSAENRVGYLASALSDYLRQELLLASRSFAFETVMSAADKVDLLREAQQRGFRTYLYFVATEDPQINIKRVAARVREGGHDVPVDKIVARYYRSLELLAEATYYSNRAYYFDNSSDGSERMWIAELGDDRVLQLKSRVVPDWFDRYLIQKMVPDHG